MTNCPCCNTPPDKPHDDDCPVPIDNFFAEQERRLLWKRRLADIAFLLLCGALAMALLT